MESVFSWKYLEETSCDRVVMASRWSPNPARARHLCLKPEFQPKKQISRVIQDMRNCGVLVAKQSEHN